MKSMILAAGLALVATGVVAQDREEFIRDNILAIFYNEFGHALIDVRDLPIFGQKEDAADVASVMLMHSLYEEETAIQMVMSAAKAFYADAVQEAKSDDVPYWDSHGASEQRYFNTICVFYGGNPDERSDMIDVMGLPEERAEGCEEEFMQADFSWGNALADIASEEGAVSFDLDVRDESAPITKLTITEELEAMNRTFALENPLPVRIESCGEANAYYDPNDQSITMCTEFEESLGLVFDNM